MRRASQLRVAVIGAGTFADSVAAYLASDGRFQIRSILDDDAGKRGNLVGGIAVTGGLEELPHLRSQGVEGVISCIGHNRTRLRALMQAREYGLETPSFVHPATDIGPSAVIAEAAIVMPGAVIQPHVSVGMGCLVSSNVVIAHHTELAAGASLAAGSIIGAGIRIGTCASFGVAASAMTGVRTIGEDAVVGSAAAVIRDVQAGTTVVGVPARVLRQAD